jgi:putative endonuclease
MQNKQFGDKGEKIASEFLKNLGYNIIKKNFRFGQSGEIDIVAKDGNVLVFCEVKTRSNENYGTGFEAINPRKQKQLVNIAKGYLMINSIEDIECRFDAIMINYKNQEYTVEHLKDVIMIM